MKTAGPEIVVFGYHAIGNIQRQAEGKTVVQLFGHIHRRRNGRMNNIAGIAGILKARKVVAGDNRVGMRPFGTGTRCNPSTADGNFGAFVAGQPGRVKE